ncbi:MAG: hypothetical protein ACI4VM_05925 [Anaerovoracaceae bacterium]
MTYEDIFRSQLNQLDLSEMEKILNSPMVPDSWAGTVSIRDLVMHMITGEAVFSWKQLFGVLQTLLLGELQGILVLAAELTGICIISGMLLGVVQQGGSRISAETGGKVCCFMGAGISLYAFYEVYLLCCDAVTVMTRLMEVSLPILFALSAAAGGTAGSLVLKSAVSGAVTGFSVMILKVILPLVFLSAVLAVVDSLGSQSSIRELSQLLRKGALFAAGLGITVFSGVLTVQGMMAKSADSLLLKTARYSVDHLIPIAGGFTADSLELVLSCIASVRNGLGIAGVVILAGILIVPLIRTFLILVVFRLTAAVLEPAGDRRICGCMKELGGCVSILSAMLLLVTIMFLIFYSIVLKSAPSV